MSYKYFPGLNPEDDVIEPGMLTKFRKLRLTDMELPDMLINKNTTVTRYVKFCSSMQKTYGKQCTMWMKR